MCGCYGLHNEQAVIPRPGGPGDCRRGARGYNHCEHVAERQLKGLVTSDSQLSLTPFFNDYWYFQRRMQNSVLLYDTLRSLARGHLIRKAGSMSNGLYLEFVPEIALVFDRLHRSGYLREVEFPGINPEAIRFFTLSDAGREKLHEVSRWFEQLPWYLRLWGRMGLPIPSSSPTGI